MLWSVKSYLPRGLTEAIYFLSFLPWLPFAWAGVPWLSVQSIVAVPNGLGLVWCTAIWLVIYWFLARGLDCLTLLMSPHQRSKDAA